MNFFLKKCVYYLVLRPIALLTLSQGGCYEDVQWLYFDGRIVTYITISFQAQLKLLYIKSRIYTVWPINANLDNLWYMFSGVTRQCIARFSSILQGDSTIIVLKIRKLETRKIYWHWLCREWLFHIKGYQPFPEILRHTYSEFQKSLKPTKQ